MVRNYIRKTARAAWSEEEMKNAIDAVRSKSMSLRKAVAAFGVPFETLRRRCNGELKLLPLDQQHKNIMGSKRTVLSPEEEAELEIFVIDMENSFYGLTIDDVRKLTYQYCERNGIRYPFNHETQMAGRDFVSCFLKRRKNLSLRKPESIALNRVFGLNKASVEKYFNNLQSVIEKYNFQPHQIYNVDESGLSCVHKPVKVLALKGKRVVSTATSGERGVTTTVVTCYNAVGNYVPPMMIFKRKRRKTELTDHAPAGTLNEVSDSGWIETGLFMRYMEHFVAHVRPTKENMALLILDGHKTHTKNLDLIDYARENYVVVISLPPHTSHKLQPLDRTFFKPLKSAFDHACSSWMRAHPARRISVDKLGELFNTAYMKAATVENAVNGFRCTGIVPFNSSILPDSTYLTDPRENEETTESLDNSILPETNVAVDSSTHSSSTLVTSSEPANNIPITECEPSEPLTAHASTEAENITPGTEPHALLSTPSSSDNESTGNTYASFIDIMKMPTIVAKKKSKRSEESEIITSTPYKKRLLSDIENRKKNTGPKAKKKETQKQKTEKSVKKVKKLKKKNNKKKVTEKENNAESSEMMNEDYECLMCGTWWKDSLPGESWLQCAKCKLWFHDLCFSSDISINVVCDFCPN